MTIIIIKLAIFLLTLLVLACFAGTETALTSLSTLSIANLKKKFPAKTIYITYWEEKPNEINRDASCMDQPDAVATSVLATSIAVDISLHLAYPARLSSGSCPSFLSSLRLYSGIFCPDLQSLPVRTGLNIRPAVHGQTFNMVFWVQPAPPAHFGEDTGHFRCAFGKGKSPSSSLKSSRCCCFRMKPCHSQNREKDDEEHH